MVGQIRLDLSTKVKEEVQPQSPLDPISPWPPHLPLETSKDEELSSKEIYGLIAVLGTYLAFAVYLVWALCPPSWLDAIGWTWYPSRDWAVIVPSYMMVVVLLAYWSYAALTPLLSPSFDSPDLIVDKHSSIPPAESERYYWKYINPETIPEAIDLPIDLVNRVLYPPRKRRSRSIPLEKRFAGEE